ncbi:MAG: hypothetical protein ACR5KX_01560 [Wolbachia sp.]
MSFGQYLKGDTLVLPCAVNIGKLVSFLRSNTNITKLSLSDSGHEKMLTVFGGARHIHHVISDQNVKELVKLKNLTELNLPSNEITNESVKEFAKLPNLTPLDLSYNEITDEDIKKLQNKLPNCRIEFKAIIKPNTEIKPNTDMKYYVGISAAIGLLLGLSTAYLEELLL